MSDRPDRWALLDRKVPADRWDVVKKATAVIADPPDRQDQEVWSDRWDRLDRRVCAVIWDHKVTPDVAD
jgi:hypothetical protein